MTVLPKRRQLALAAVAWCGGLAATVRCAGLPGADAVAAPAPPEADAAAAFRRLRTVRGHFDGGPWNDDVDKWQGRKHVAMQRVAEQALRTRADAAHLRRSLGEPDAVLAPRSAGHARAAESAQWLAGSGSPPQPAGNRATLWLYRWRGTHDQLVLALQGGRVRAAGWWYERE